jgi:hypothetical protein
MMSKGLWVCRSWWHLPQMQLKQDILLDFRSIGRFKCVPSKRGQSYMCFLKWLCSSTQQIFCKWQASPCIYKLQQETMLLARIQSSASKSAA